MASERSSSDRNGLGALAILIARTVGDCTIDTVTLAGEQRDFAVERIAKAGLSDRIHVHHMDFRQCRAKPEWAGAFDRFVSVEMIENVGKDFIEEFWSVADWALKPHTAVGVVQVITMPEASESSQGRSPPWGSCTSRRNSGVRRVWRRLHSEMGNFKCNLIS